MRRLFGLLLVAVPFVFGALRALSTGTDFRYVWIAVATTITGWIALKAGLSTNKVALGRLMVAIVASTLVATAVGFAQGASSVPAVLVVGAGFAICSSVGFYLLFRGRAR